MLIIVTESAARKFFRMRTIDYDHQMAIFHYRVGFCGFLAQHVHRVTNCMVFEAVHHLYVYVDSIPYRNFHRPPAT